MSIKTIKDLLLITRLIPYFWGVISIVILIVEVFKNKRIYSSSILETAFVFILLFASARVFNHCVRYRVLLTLLLLSSTYFCFVPYCMWANIVLILMLAYIIPFGIWRFLRNKQTKSNQ